MPARAGAAIRDTVTQRPGAQAGALAAGASSHAPTRQDAGPPARASPRARDAYCAPCFGPGTLHATGGPSRAASVRAGHAAAEAAPAHSRRQQPQPAAADRRVATVRVARTEGALSLSLSLRAPCLSLSQGALSLSLSLSGRLVSLSRGTLVAGACIAGAPSVSDKSPARCACAAGSSQPANTAAALKAADGL